MFSAPPVPVEGFTSRRPSRLPARWISFKHCYDFSVRVQGAVNVGPQSRQRAFDQIVHAALRIGDRGGLVNAQRFLEQINRLLARAVERFDKIFHTVASLRFLTLPFVAQGFCESTRSPTDILGPLIPDGEISPVVPTIAATVSVFISGRVTPAGHHPASEVGLFP